MPEATEFLRPLTVGQEVRTFKHGLKGGLLLYPCTLEKNDVVCCLWPRLLHFRSKPLLVAPCMPKNAILLVPVFEMGLAGDDLDWIVEMWNQTLTLKPRSSEITEEEIAIFKQLGRPALATLN